MLNKLLHQVLPHILFWCGWNPNWWFFTEKQPVGSQGLHAPPSPFVFCLDSHPLHIKHTHAVQIELGKSSMLHLLASHVWLPEDIYIIMYIYILYYYIYILYIIYIYVCVIYILISSRVSEDFLRIPDCGIQIYNKPGSKSLPVRVMPPMKSPSTAAMFSMLAPASGVSTKEPMEVPMEVGLSGSTIPKSSNIWLVYAVLTLKHHVIYFYGWYKSIKISWLAEWHCFTNRCFGRRK